MNDTPEMDAALEQRLCSYFAARYGEPPTATAIWTQIQSRMDSEPTEAPNDDAPSHDSRQTRALPLQHATRRRTRRWLVALGPLAAVLAIIVVAAYLFANHPHAGRPPTSSNTPTKSGIWNVIRLPAGITYDLRTVTLTVAPSDGNTAYLCHTVGGKPEIWKTTDGGQSWTRTPQSYDQGSWSLCHVVVDSVNPNVAVMELHTDDGAGPVATLLSKDGGAHWRLLPAAAEDNDIAHLFTHADASYTIMGSDLYVSRDQLQTWSQIDPPAIVHTHSPAPEGIFGLWVQPVSGRILVVLFYDTETNGRVTEFWTSADQGAHWTRLGFPNEVPDAIPYVTGAVVTPVGSDSFAICTLLDWAKAPATIQVTIACSQDGGRTWTQRPLPPGYDTPTNHFMVTLLGVDQQGAVTLAGANNLPNDNVLIPDPTPIRTTMHLLLLAAGATQASDWQDLGETHDVSPTFLFGRTSNGVMVWELPFTPTTTVYTTTVP